MHHNIITNEPIDHSTLLYSKQLLALCLFLFRQAAGLGGVAGATVRKCMRAYMKYNCVYNCVYIYIYSFIYVYIIYVYLYIWHMV